VALTLPGPDSVWFWLSAAPLAPWSTANAWLTAVTSNKGSNRFGSRRVNAKVKVISTFLKVIYKTMTLPL
jgi:hypothetical protein